MKDWFVAQFRELHDKFDAVVETQRQLKAMITKKRNKMVKHFVCANIHDIVQFVYIILYLFQGPV